MNAESILKSVIEKYRSFSSYADVGTVETLPSQTKSEIEFKTYFMRPNKVRFDWRDWHSLDKTTPADENAIWSNGKNSYAWFLGELEHEESLGLAMAGATGVSSCSVLMILQLLFPECVETNSVWFEMQNMQIESQELTGLHCYHLVGTETKPDDTEAWISKEDLIVRRLISKTEITAEEDRAFFEETVEMLKAEGRPKEYWPTKPTGARKYYDEFNYQEVKINEPIADAIFEFDPTKKET